MDIYHLLKLILGIVVIITVPLAVVYDKRKNPKKMNILYILMIILLFVLGISSIIDSLT